MKKTLSLVLACLLTFGMIAAAQATPYYLEHAGVTIEIPEGMTAQDASTEASYLLTITVDADANLKYAYSLQYITELAGKNIEDLTDEEGQALLSGLASAITDPQYTTTETDSYKLLVVASGDGTQMHYISLLNGWLCDVAVGRADGTLTDTDIQTAAGLLTSIQLDTDAQTSETETPAK